MGKITRSSTELRPTAAGGTAIGESADDLHRQLVDENSVAHRRFAAEEVFGHEVTHQADLGPFLNVLFGEVAPLGQRPVPDFGITGGRPDDDGHLPTFPTIADGDVALAAHRHDQVSARQRFTKFLGVFVGKGQCSSAHGPALNVAAKHESRIGTEPLDDLHGLALGPVHSRHDHRKRSDSKGHAEHNEEAAQLVGPQSSQGHFSDAPGLPQQINWA